jgi:hypothetical protein
MKSSPPDGHGSNASSLTARSGTVRPSPRDGSPPWVTPVQATSMGPYSAGWLPGTASKTRMARLELCIPTTDCGDSCSHDCSEHRSTDRRSAPSGAKASGGQSLRGVRTRRSPLAPRDPSVEGLPRRAKRAIDAPVPASPRYGKPRLRHAMAHFSRRSLRTGVQPLMQPVRHGIADT